MFEKLNLGAGVFALLLFVVAQTQGWNLFENDASGHSGRSGSGRTYHK